MTSGDPRAWLAAVLIVFGPLPSCLAGEPSVQWKSDAENPGHATVEVRGLDAARVAAWKRADWSAAEWSKVLAIYVVPESEPRAGEKLPAMVGSYRLDGEVLRFEPQFPLAAGMKYRALLQLSANGAGDLAARVAIFEVPVAKATAATVVTQVYPTTAKIPENLLKFYVHFSAPMKRGEAYQHVHLLDEKGMAVELPFLELDEELWNPAMTRLTLFIDPGRIKRGVRPLEEVGPALEAGKSMRLAIDPTWQDAAGKPLAKKFEKAFDVGPPDRDPPDPERWQMKVPRAGTRTPLVVEFGKPMDQAMAQRVIEIKDLAGRRIAGEVRIAEEECRWSFVPAEAWAVGKFEISVPTSIEDLAGNNIGKPFDVDLHERKELPAGARVVKLPVEIR